MNTTTRHRIQAPVAMAAAPRHAASQPRPRWRVIRTVAPHPRGTRDPRTNGKVERLNRTLATEWAYSRIWSSNADRAAALPAWLQHYNLERPHLGIGGLTPIERVNNAAGQYI